MEHGEIIVTREDNMRGAPMRFTYEWIGPPVTSISAVLLDDIYTSEIDGCEGWVTADIGDRFRIGPYKVRVIDKDWAWDRLIVAFDGNAFPLWYLRYWVPRWLDIFYRRLIVCLSVFNLAEYDPATIPSWHDIRWTFWK